LVYSQYIKTTLLILKFAPASNINPYKKNTAGKLFTGLINATTVGKIDLKKMLIHLMGFWSVLSQSGMHHSCSNNKKAFHETMDVLNNVIHCDKLLTEDSLMDEKDWIGHFVMKQATPAGIKTEEFNRKWDRIVQMIKDRVISCKIGREAMRSAIDL
jgi:hypothetical protein